MLPNEGLLLGARMNLLQDVRFGVRTLLKNPSFAGIAVLTLALGIGANSAIFGVVNALLLRPYLFHDLDELVLIRQAGDERAEESLITPADFLDLSRDKTLFQSAAAFRFHDFNLARAGDTESASGYAISPNLFDVVGVAPLLGRTFLPDEGTPGRDQVAVLNYGYWQRRFGADPTIIGKPVSIDGRSFTVIGIMPKDFNYPLAAEIWIPLALTPPQMADRTTRSLFALARLRPRRSLRASQAALANAGRVLGRQYPSTNSGRGFLLLRLREEQYRYTAPLFLMLQAAAFFVLLLAMGNVANLVLIRTVGRRKELAMRTALGAGTLRLVQFFAAEALILCLVAGAAATAAAGWSVTAIRNSLSRDYTKWLAGWDTMHFDGTVLGFGLVIVGILTLAFAALVAMHASRLDINHTLKEAGGTASSFGHGRLRSAFVGMQVVLALVLLVGSGLMIQGFARLQRMFNMLDPAHMLRFEVRLPERLYPEAKRAGAFQDQLLTRMSALPGVETAAVVTNPPASNVDSPTTLFSIEGRPALRPADLPSADVQKVSAAAFRIMKVPLLAGRLLTVDDGADAPPVAVISESMARRFWPTANPINQRINLGDGAFATWLTVVGVVGDTRLNWFDPQPHATIYVPYGQSPERSTAVLLRTSGDPLNLTAAVRSAIWNLDPGVAVGGSQSMADEVRDSLAPLRLISVLMLVFGGVALTLSAVGLYGVVAHSVAQRTHEFGIRVALGAELRDVAKLVLGESMKIATIALAVGAVLATVLTRIVASQMFGIIALSPLVVLGFAGILFGVAIVASYIPARRATKVDPLIALRHE